MQPSEIQELRFSLGMSQEEFAKHIGVSKRSVINYESGDTTPNARTLYELEKVKSGATHRSSAESIAMEPEEQYGDKDVTDIMLSQFSKLTTMISGNDEKIMKVLSVNGLNIVDIKKHLDEVMKAQESFNRMFSEFMAKAIDK